MGDGEQAIRLTGPEPETLYKCECWWTGQPYPERVAYDDFYGECPVHPKEPV